MSYIDLVLLFSPGCGRNGKEEEGERTDGNVSVREISSWPNVVDKEGCYARRHRVFEEN